MKSRGLHNCASQRRWIFGALLTLAITGPADADDGRPRYVSGSGVDRGDCLNKFRPCRTLDYAIARSGKADTIRAAEGSYAIDDANGLLRLLAAQGRLEGGYGKYSAYSERTATAQTMLIGVPPEFRERFERAGFSVLVDRKGIAQDEQRKMRRLTKQIQATEQSHKAAPCVANQSQGYPCESVSLLSHLSLPDLMPNSARGNDVWGFTDLNTGREYAFMGLERGVAIIEVSNPEAPEVIATFVGSPTTWRDIKIHQRYDVQAKRWRAYAYVTADNVLEHPMLLDLSGLPNGINRGFFAPDFTAAHNAYLVGADYTYGLALTADVPQLGIAGGRENGGDHRLYSLADPQAPSRTTKSTAGYAHDLASHVVTDSRKATQCATRQAAPVCHVLSDFNENTLDLWDVTDPTAPEMLSSTSYPNASYVHSGWWTEDGRYLLVHDELDEINVGLNTTVRVFDMANLRAPALAATWVGPSAATDHNGFVRGNRYYISNYSEGLTILDLTDPRAPRRVGFFDTYPSTSANGFVGAWGAYPFFESGTIAIGDINTGLYLVRDETRATAAGSFAFVNATYSTSEGDALALHVSRNGGTQGPASVEFEVLHASTDGQDVRLDHQALSWADGEGGSKSATLHLLEDSASENIELALVRLKSPVGGATLVYPDTARVHVSDASSSTRLRFLDHTITVDEARGKAIVTVTRQGSAAGEARVTYGTVQSSTYAGFSKLQGELTWANGDAASKEIAIPLDPIALGFGKSGSFYVELMNPVGATLEHADGSDALQPRAEVGVFDTTAPAPPSPPPPSPGGGSGNNAGGGGGGSATLGWLSLLALLATARWRTVSVA